MYAVLRDGTVAITGYVGEQEDLLLPSRINGHPVTTIAEGAFALKKNKRG